MPIAPRFVVPDTASPVSVPTDMMFGWAFAVTVTAVVAEVAVVALPAFVAYVAFATVPVTLAPATAFAVPAVVADPALVA